MKVNILGVEWKVVLQTLEENEYFRDCDGYCDPSVKTIFIRQYTEEEQSNAYSYKSGEYMRKKVTRHEIVHAFMFESGLWRNSFSVDMAWSMNEEMIDWIAIQSPKIFKAFQEVGCL